MRYKIYYSCISHVGKCRESNQDNFICGGRFIDGGEEPVTFPIRGCQNCGENVVVGVFDGMGGEECGEVAARIAAERAAKISAKEEPLEVLEEFCRDANKDICTWAKEHEITSMGTTAALLVFAEEKIGLCNIGDSKIFRFAGKKLEQISVDHYAIGIYGRKPPLSQNLGIPKSELLIEPYLAIGNYNNEDMYLLCSDGLTDMVEQKEIANILEDTPFEEITEKLLSRALECGGKDNITIILCRIEKESLFEKIFRRS